MYQTKNKKYFKAFTLVELIIVITILAILATIAFVSFQNYTSSARDSNRVATLTQVEKGLDIYSVQVGNLPIPENPKSFTGGQNGNIEIKQGVLTKGVLQTLGSTPIDPITGKQYTYSVFGNGKYYQVGTNLEKQVSSDGIVGNQAFADTFKTVKLVGNYKYDPSLPSLIIGSGSDIFSPDTCFVVNGGMNTFDNCSVNKKNLSGNTSDSSLVGYWDMETRTDDNLRLKDLSGNGNDGFFTGGLNYNTSLTGGKIGSGLYFNPGTTIGQAIEVSYNNVLKPKHITMSVIFRGDGRYGIGEYPYIITNGDPSTNTDGMNGVFLNLDKKNLLGAYTFASNGGMDVRGPIISTQIYYYGTLVYDGNFLSIYVDGKLFKKEKATRPIHWESEYKGLLFARAVYNTPSITGDFQGIIDEVKIYNRALSDEEILQQARIAGF